MASFSNLSSFNHQIVDLNNSVVFADDNLKQRSRNSSNNRFKANSSTNLKVTMPVITGETDEQLRKDAFFNDAESIESNNKIKNKEKLNVKTSGNSTTTTNNSSSRSLSSSSSHSSNSSSTNKTTTINSAHAPNSLLTSNHESFSSANEILDMSNSNTSGVANNNNNNTNSIGNEYCEKKQLSKSQNLNGSAVFSSSFQVNGCGVGGGSSGGVCGVGLTSNSPETFKRHHFGSIKESSYKKQKENYLTEKKRITNDMLTIMRDERIIVLADWLKVRGSLKNWIKLYVILKPGIMQLYKSDKIKPGQWVGTIILNSCKLLERPSKKHGFCFKLFHPMEKSIWATKGPAGETYINVPYMLLPTFYLIFRASSEKIGNIWMDALELTLKSSHLLKPPATNYLCPNFELNESLKLSNNLNPTTATTTNFTNTAKQAQNIEQPKTYSLNQSLNSNCSNLSQSQSNLNNSVNLNTEANLNNQSVLSGSNANNESDIENRHFKEIGDNLEETVLSDSDGAKNSSDEACSLNSSLNNNEDEEYYDEEEDNQNSNNRDRISNGKKSLRKSNVMKNGEICEVNNDKCENVQTEEAAENEDEDKFAETKYMPSPKEEFGELGNKGQTEEVGEENKSLIFCLVKQVRPGMDLSKVVLPTFILEPRSFLEKLTDYYYHSDILLESINNDDPYERMKTVVKFYLSGFYKKPKGLKKPYNPILGEVFRSYWYNPRTKSKTFYVAEQVSHHPPISSFYVSNRKDGFCIYGTVLARSKFYGNSVSAILEGNVKLILLNRGEEYVITLPYANCKGILIGKLTMELGGKVNIECAKTGYSTEIEFKLKPLLGGIEASNLIDGKIKFAKETIATIHGKWDGEIILQDKRAEQKQMTLWCPSRQVIESRLKRFIVPVDEQAEFESEKLWLKVSEAIQNSDQNLATEEKTKIELKQRESDLERKAKFTDYRSRLFAYDNLNKEWIYNYSDLRPWDLQADLFQYEKDFKIITKTKHNLKLSNRRITNPRSSLLALHHQTPHLTRHHHRLVSNVVAESNECLATNESYDLLVQYNDIKQRLEQIEDNLKQLNAKIEPQQQQQQQFQQQTQPQKSQLSNEHLNFKNGLIFKSSFSSSYSPSSSSSVFEILNSHSSSVLLIALIAWFLGILSLLLTQKIFSCFF